MIINEWSIKNIFESIGRRMPCKGGEISARVDSPGWSIYFFPQADSPLAAPAIEYKNLDITAAARILNDFEATLHVYDSGL